MQITVFGASGKVGRQVVELALEEGHSVVAFVHSQNPFKNEPKVRVVQGNVSNAEKVAEALKGSEAVISALGSWGTQAKDILSKGMRNIIPAMQQQGIKRIITLTGAGAQWSNDRPGLLSKSSHFFIKLASAKVLADGEEHLRLLDDSELEWTCVRAPIMTDGQNYAYQLGLKEPPAWALIPRLAVTHALVDLVTTREFLRQAPYIRKA